MNRPSPNLMSQIDELAKLIRKTKDEMLKEEVRIKSLGPDLLETFQGEELAVRKQIEIGSGSFLRLNDLISRIANAKETNKTRQQSYSAWEALRLKLNSLETRIERLRIEYNKEVKKNYYEGSRQA